MGISANIVPHESPTPKPQRNNFTRSMSINLSRLAQTVSGTEVPDVFPYSSNERSSFPSGNSQVAAILSRINFWAW